MLKLGHVGGHVGLGGSVGQRAQATWLQEEAVPPGESNLSYNLRSLCDLPLSPLLPCSFSKEKKKKEKEKAAMCHKGTDWQTSASCLIYLFLFFFKRKGYRANSSLQSPHSLNKPNGGCWQGIDSLLMKEFLTK